MKKIEKQPKQINVSDVKKALKVQTGVRAGQGTKRCVLCGQGGSAGSN